MEEKYKNLEKLYTQMREIDDLAHQKYRIDLSVRDRAYTDNEYEEEGRLEAEIQVKRKQFTQARNAYTKTFTSLDEFAKLEDQINLNQATEYKDKGYYDQRKYSGMRAIMKETQADFEIMKKMSTYQAQNVDNERQNDDDMER